MGEYINKTKFLEQLQQELSEISTIHHDHIDFEKQMYEFAIKKVEDVDVEDVEIVKHGHWIDRTVWIGGLGRARRECSCCGTIFDGKAFSRKSGIGFKYCEECGAKMERE